MDPLRTPGVQCGLQEIFCDGMGDEILSVEMTLVGLRHVGGR